MKGKFGKFAAIVSLTVAALTSSMAVHAEHVQADTPWYSGMPLESLAKGPAGTTVNTTQLVWGTSLSVNAIAASSAGRLSVRLTDIQWPNPLQSLSLLVTDLNGMWSKWELPAGGTGTGDLIFNLAGPANLFVAVFARSENKYEPGLYNLQANFSPVPLPAAVWLLLSGLGGLAVFRRKRHDQ